MPFKKEIGLLIQKQRKDKELRQEDLAIKSGLSRSYICDIENGRYVPSLETLMKISQALALPITDLMPLEKRYVNENKN